MTKFINIWAPILKEDDWPTMSLAVRSGPKTPNEAEYRERLYDLLNELISANPKQAERDMDENCVSQCPDLCNIRAECPTKEWAYQISQCAQMSFLLARIDWQKDNPPRRLPEDDLPSFMDILQMI